MLVMTTTEEIVFVLEAFVAIFDLTELSIIPGLEKDWDDPNKPDLRTKIKGVLTNLKLTCWDFVGRPTPPRQKSPDSVGFCSELSVTGLPC